MESRTLYEEDEAAVMGKSALRYTGLCEEDLQFDRFNMKPSWAIFYFTFIYQFVCNRSEKNM
jgi:hypothetical protein